MRASNAHRSGRTQTRRELIKSSGSLVAASAWPAWPPRPRRREQHDQAGPGRLRRARHRRGRRRLLHHRRPGQAARHGRPVRGSPAGEPEQALRRQFADKVDVPPERQFLGFDAYKKAIDCLGPGDVVLLTTHAAFRPHAFRVRRAEGRERLHGEVVRRRCAGRAPPAEGRPRSRSRRTSRSASASCGGTRRRGRRSSSGSTTARSATCTRCGSTACTARSHCPPLPKDANELAFQIQHAHSFNWVCRRVLHRLALPQHRRRLLGQERLARLGPGHGRTLLSRGGQPVRPLHGRVHLRRRRQAVRLLAAHGRLLGDLRRLRPRHRRARR